MEQYLYETDHYLLYSFFFAFQKKDSESNSRLLFSKITMIPNKLFFQFLYYNFYFYPYITKINFNFFLKIKLFIIVHRIKNFDSNYC